MNAARHKEEVTQEQFEAHVREYPRALEFDGVSYTETIAAGGITWRKPVAFCQGEKFFIVKDE